MQHIKTIFLAIVGNLITPLVISVGGFVVAFYVSTSLESKLILCSIALSLSIIILILNNRFSFQRVRVVRILEQKEIYLVDKGVARHIPDMTTFEYLGQIYGFRLGDLEKVKHDEFKKQFSKGSSLPSVNSLFAGGTK